MDGVDEDLEEFVARSKNNEENILDTAFTAMEIQSALVKLKNKKAGGPDGLTSEYLKEGGGSVVIWMMRILNAVRELEAVPDCLKCGIIIPVYKGGGKDALKVDSYRSVTLSSAIAKVLELVILERMMPILIDAGIPHENQTAYIKKVSCADAIFATQEVIRKYMSEGSVVHTSLYDLSKAFDSVEYPVLLKRLFDVGINGKLWRLLKDWYKRAACVVRSNGRLSEDFPISRGVKQGSVLSPTFI